MRVPLSFGSFLERFAGGGRRYVTGFRKDQYVAAGFPAAVWLRLPAGTQRVSVEVGRSTRSDPRDYRKFRHGVNFYPLARSARSSDAIGTAGTTRRRTHGVEPIPVRECVWLLQGAESVSARRPNSPVRRRAVRSKRILPGPKYRNFTPRSHRGIERRNYLIGGWRSANELAIIAQSLFLGMACTVEILADAASGPPCEADLT